MTMPGFSAESALQPNRGQYATSSYRASGAPGAVTPQSWLERARCAACCHGKRGYLACVGRCLLDGRCCHGGVDCD